MNAATAEELHAIYLQKLDAAEARYNDQLATSAQPESLRIAMVRVMSQALIAHREALQALEARS
jgi:hypothetical protein